jgi:hypothetical protein
MGGTPPAPPALTKSLLEEKSLRSQIRAAWAQVIGTMVSALTVLVAVFVAWQGWQTVNHSSQTTLQQSEDSQLSAAITALGYDNSAERIAGLALLQRDAADRIALSAKTGESPADIFNNYQTVLRIFSGYVSSQGQTFLTASSAQASTPFGRGYGVPASPGTPLDVIYAADQVKLMLDLDSEVAPLSPGRPVIDLSNDELMSQSWKGINFSWIADLRGADVQGANFRHASIQGVKGTYFYGTAQWSRPPSGIKVLPAKDWNQYTCLRSKSYWDNWRTSASASMPVSSTEPVPSVAPSPISR